MAPRAFRHGFLIRLAYARLIGRLGEGLVEHSFQGQIQSLDLEQSVHSHLNIASMVSLK